MIAPTPPMGWNSWNTFGPDINEQIVRETFPLKPAELIKYLDLRRPIYLETARHGHFGREGAGFTWEKTDRVSDVRSAANTLKVR